MSLVLVLVLACAPGAPSPRPDQRASSAPPPVAEPEAASLAPRTPHLTALPSSGGCSALSETAEPSAKAWEDQGRVLVELVLSSYCAPQPSFQLEVTDHQLTLWEDDPYGMTGGVSRCACMHRVSLALDDLPPGPYALSLGKPREMAGKALNDPAPPVHFADVVVP